MEDVTDGGGPPLASAVCCRDVVVVQSARDLREAVACVVLAADACGDLVVEKCSAALPSWRWLGGATPSSAFRDETLELVDWDESRAPGHVYRLDVREEPSQCRRTDPECLGGLAARVGEPLDVARRAHDRARSARLSWRDGWDGLCAWPAHLRRWERRAVAARFLFASLLAAARHSRTAYTNGGMVLHQDASVSLLLSRLVVPVRGRFVVADWGRFSVRWRG